MIAEATLLSLELFFFSMTVPTEDNFSVDTDLALELLTIASSDTDGVDTLSDSRRESEEIMMDNSRWRGSKSSEISESSAKSLE